MRARRELTVVTRVPVLTRGESHCDNDCSYMTTLCTLRASGEHENYEARCTLFYGKLTWDKKCKAHGYFRQPECVKRAKEE
jgi:hypothetical protein